VLRAVSALLRQTYPVDSYEIIVSCDRCTDGTADSLHSAFGDRVRVLNSEAPGPSGAVNTALKHARGELVIVLDDEMEANEGLISAHVQAHRTEPGAAIVVTGYSAVVMDSGATPFTRMVARDYENYFAGMSMPRGESTPNDLCGSNFSVPIAAFAEVGGYNERYSFQRNDFELAVRLLHAGYEIRFCRAAQSRQHLAINAGVVIDRTMERARNDCRLAFDYPWCVPYLPFYRTLINRTVRYRWRVLWEIAPIAAGVFGIARRVFPENLWPGNLEYAARYCVGLRKELGSWRAFRQLASDIN
jgi:GT2 family glycosyltransferase